jgi:arylsulfatase A-like enzyme
MAVEALVLVGHYPFAHELLRRATVILGAISLLTLGRAPRVFGALALACLVLCLAALMVLGPERARVVSALRAAPFPELAIDDLRGLADTDLDGFSGWLAGGDCAPFDAAVHPDAQEVPGNGKDDNCRLGDLARLPERPLPVVHASAAPVSLMLITIDTLRADHVGAYGYERQTTPNIDAFFASGLRCADAIAAGAYTTISMPALMRGYHARHLRWEVGRQTDHFRLLPASGSLREGEGWFRAHLLAFDPQHRPLAALLLPLGFHTWAVVDDGGWGFLSSPLMGQGFERFLYVPNQSANMWAPEGDAHVARAALAALQARDERPFFLWIHFIGVHAPDAKHEGVPIFGPDAVAAYDHEIARVDRELAAVLRELAAIERERPLVTMLTADHGEEFFPQGRAHGSTLSESEIRVPLLMRGAGVPHRLVREPVSLVDVAPTLLARAGVSEGAGFDGLDILDGRKLGARQAVLSDVWRYDARGVLEFDRVAAVGGSHRLVFEAARNSTRLYQRGEEGALVFSQDAALEDAVARYLEVTGPRPTALLP